MRQGTYLNVILTVNAALLGCVLWTQVAGHPPDWSGLTQTASAQTPTTPALGIPDAGQQRQKMIELLGDLNASLDATRKVFESGKLKVEVTNPIKEVRVSNLNEIRTDKKP